MSYIKSFYFKTGQILSLLCLMFIVPKLQAQQNLLPKTKATEVDTLWGADNSTPDSVAYNVYSRPNIVKTYGRKGENPDLDWENMSPNQKKKYFKEKMKAYFSWIPQYTVINNNGDTVFYINGQLCHFYATIACNLIGGENNIENDPNGDLNAVSAIRDTVLKRNGYFNLPIFYVSDWAGDSANKITSHAICGIFLKDRITQNTTLNDFAFIDPVTDDTAGPGTFYMINWKNIKGWGPNSVSIIRNGYFHGQFFGGSTGSPYNLMTFEFDSSGQSYLFYLNPRTITINPHLINIQNKAPNDTTIDYSTDWPTKLKSFITSVNQDTTEKMVFKNAYQYSQGNQIKTDTAVTKIWYTIGNSESFLDTIPSDSGEAAKYNFRITKKNVAKFVQEGVYFGSPLYPNGYYYHTTLKANSATQTITVSDMEAPTGTLSKSDTTVSSSSEAEQAALALITNVQDNSRGTVYKRDTLESSSDSLMIYRLGLEDVTGNKTSLGQVEVNISTTGVEEHFLNAGYGIIKAYPNPLTGNMLHIEYKAKTPGNVTFNLYNLSGNRIKSVTRDLTQGINRVDISLQGVLGGNYILGCGMQRVKVVRE